MKTTADTKVFLGGTCNESNWPDRLVDELAVSYFNLVVDDWTPDCQAEELREIQFVICGPNIDD